MALERKVAVITGASQGIGASVMEGFRQIGYGVVANSRAIAFCWRGFSQARVGRESSGFDQGRTSQFRERAHASQAPQN